MYGWKASDSPKTSTSILGFFHAEIYSIALIIFIENYLQYEKLGLGKPVEGRPG
jgi:hypothetical protein